jgi:Arc/MetJ-type ribon-helix-helix transcriptional regulator
MKKKISISIDEKTIEKLEELMKDSSFRNKSHALELALTKLIEGRK